MNKLRMKSKELKMLWNLNSQVSLGRLHRSGAKSPREGARLKVEFVTLP